MGIMRYVDALRGKGKKYGKVSEKNKKIREETAARLLYSGTMRELSESLRDQEINRNTYEILRKGLEHAYHSFEEGKIPYKGFESIMENYTKKGIIFKGICQQEKKRGGRIERAQHSLEESLAAALLFLLVATSLYLPGSVTGAAVQEIRDTGLRNAFFFLGSVIAVAISYLCFKRD